MRKMISQREAHRLRKRVQQLEEAENVRRRVWASEYPGGTHIVTWTLQANDPQAVAIRTARTLRHAVVVLENDGILRFMALAERKA